MQPLYFRPPYDNDEEPDTDDEAAPVWRIQQDGLTIIGSKIDTDDWNEHPRKTPQEIIDSVLAQLKTMKTKPQFRGSIILMHDGGGDRSVTVESLGPLIDALRAHGYTLVPVSALMGKTTAQVMPPLTFWQRMRTIPDSIAFSALDIIGNFIVMVFFVGDILMSARLIVVGLFAFIDRLRKPHRQATAGYNPRVAVLIPAYNEETVIVRTIRSVLNSDYKNLHVIVIDDGSLDRTAEVAAAAYAQEIAAGRVQVLTKRNGGKAAALNYGLERMNEEIFVGIDADTVIATDAISKLIPHFEDPADRRHGRQRQSGQSREPVDALAGSRVHHQPELRAPRPRPVPRRHRRSRRHWRVAHRASEGRGRLSAEHRGRGRRPDHEPARAEAKSRLRGPRTGLH